MLIGDEEQASGGVGGSIFRRPWGDCALRGHPSNPSRGTGAGDVAAHTLDSGYLLRPSYKPRARCVLWKLPGRMSAGARPTGAPVKLQMQDPSSREAEGTADSGSTGV